MASSSRQVFGSSVGITYHHLLPSTIFLDIYIEMNWPPKHSVGEVLFARSDFKL